MIGLVFSILFFNLTPLMNTTTDELSIFLPDSVNQFRSIGDDRFLNPENLYGYIDGGAELYLSYGFKVGVHREYKSNSGAEIYADIFDMNSSKNAFGVFSHSRETDEQGFGQGSQDYGDAVIFWKDHYYIAISSRGEDAGMKEALHLCAAYIDRAIKSTGELPDILRHLPPEGLVPASPLYFNHYVWQNSYCYLTDDNLLKIDSTTDAVLARYKTDGETLCLMMVKYPSVQLSNDSFKSISATMKPEHNTWYSSTGENGKWIIAQKKDFYLVVIFNVTVKTSGEELMQRVINNL